MMMLISSKGLWTKTTIHLRILIMSLLLPLLALHQLSHLLCYLNPTILPFPNQSSRWIASLIITINTTTPSESLVCSFIRRIQIESAKTDRRRFILASKHKRTNQRQCCVVQEYRPNHSSTSSKNSRNGLQKSN